MAEARIGIVTNTTKSGAKELLPRLIEGFEGRGVSTRLEKGGAGLIGGEGLELNELADSVDLLVVLGGDGTILHTVHLLRDKLKPLAGMNLGSLGFLTCATTDNLDEFIRVIAEKEYTMSSRSVLKVEVGGHDIVEAYYGLNEAAITRSDASGIISLEARIDGAFFSNYSGDGLIVATPTGSTAYSFSAGGAIVEPESEVFLLTPICPHSLANRSMVVSNTARIEVALAGKREDGVLTVDGKFIRPVGPETEIRVGRAPFDLSLVMMPGQTFYQILQQKLRWHGSNV